MTKISSHMDGGSHTMSDSGGDEDVPIAHAPSEAAQLAEQIRSELLIKIFIADSTEPYLVPQSTLEGASEYFKNALKYVHLASPEEQGTLRFPEDDQEVWKLPLFFIYKGELPAGAQEDGEGYHPMQALMVKCWVAGDKYMMPDFQNSAIFHLLYWLDVPKVPYHEQAFTPLGPFPWKVMRLAFQNSIPGSPLRRIFGAAALEANFRNIDDNKGGFIQGPHDMDALEAAVESAPGAVRDMMVAASRDEREGHGEQVPDRYLIKEAFYRAYYFDEITVGHGTFRGSKADKVLAVLRDALRARIDAFLEEIDSHKVGCQSPARGTKYVPFRHEGGRVWHARRAPPPSFGPNGVSFKQQQ